MDFLFGIFPVLFIAVFVMVIGTFVVGAVRGISSWNKNNHSPRLTVEATVVAKRDEHHRHRHNSANNMSHTTYSTRYFATFQFESGDRLELELQGSQYGMLIEGDRGKLSFQGTRYLGFERG